MNVMQRELWSLSPATRPVRGELVVIASCDWTVHSGGIWAGSSGGIRGQLTKCRVGAVVFYVRENLGGIDRFLMTSNERLGMKKGQAPKDSIQVLDLCAPPEAWEEVAAAVRADDAKAGREPRPVRRHRAFTEKWAEERLVRS